MIVPNDYDAPVSRPWQVLAGLLLTPLALGALAIAYAGASLAFSGRELPPGSGVFYPAAALVGIGGLWLSWRLVLGRTRHEDGGLLSPNALRFAGCVFLAGGVAATFRSPLMLLELGFILATTLACFGLARRREITRRRSLNRPWHSRAR